jgi:uncharacterized protein
MDSKLLTDAVKKGDVDVVEQLLKTNETYGIDLPELLHNAIWHTYLDTIDIIAKFNIGIEIYRNYYEIPLCDAMKQRSANATKIVKILIEANSDINKTKHYDCEKLPLSLSARFNFVNIVEMLIEVKANVNRIDSHGRTLLSMIAEDGNFDMIEILLNSKANPNQDCHLTPLYMACQNKHIDIINILLNFKANVNVADHIMKCTPLLRAAGSNDVDVLFCLIRSKANLNKSNYCGETPVYSAAKYNSVDALEMLLKSKADPNKITDSGEFPIIIGIKEGNDDCIKLLTNAKANPDHNS